MLWSLELFLFTIRQKLAYYKIADCGCTFKATQSGQNNHYTRPRSRTGDIVSSMFGRPAVFRFQTISQQQSAKLF